jgi:hypothetical protein
LPEAQLQWNRVRPTCEPRYLEKVNAHQAR